MDPRAVKFKEIDPKQPHFRLDAAKRNGAKRQRFYLKFNHAVRALYRITGLSEGSVTFVPTGRRRLVRIIMRFKKKRGFNTEVISSLDDRKQLKEAGKYWHRLPRKDFNELE